MHTLQLKGLLLALSAGVFASCQPKEGKPAAQAGNGTVSEKAGGNSSQQLAYVDIDSLEAHYDYFKQKKAELEKKKEGIQNQLGATERQLQNELAMLQQKAPTMTQAEGQAAEQSLQRKAQQHELNRQNLIAQLQTQEAQFNEDLQKRLDESIKEFNKDRRYTFIFSYRSGASNILYKDQAYDVTNEVIKLLNSGAAKK